MPATIVQSNDAPFAKVAIDPVTLDIIENALRNARVEMDATLVRTAMSPGIREQGDAFPLITDHLGRMIVGQFGSYIGPFLEGYDGSVEDGDLILLSDPYSVQGAISHCNDWLVLLPVFKDGRIIAYTSMFGHQSDIGGKVVGSMPIDTRSIFEEGVRIPPVKLWKRGVHNDDLVKLILHQTRKPDWCAADLNALIASCRVAARRVIEMATRFGDDVYISATQELLARNHRAMKHLIDTSIGEQPVTFEDYICDDGLGYGPYRIKCTMWREHGRVVLDFAGTDRQSQASINFLLNENMMRMFFGIYMIMVFDPQILFNDGFYDLIDVRIPRGSLLKPTFPAALSGRTHALGRLFDILGGLLGQKTPEFLNAAGFSSSPHLFYSGVDKTGEWFQLFQIGFGGIPGRPLGDGPDGHSLWPGFTNVPNEFLERYFPLMIERYETVADTGGAGLHRGGNGICMTYRFLAPGTIAIHDDRWFTHPWGVNGGAPGARARKVLIAADGTRTVVGNKVEDVVVAAGDQLEFITWGGGGWGDPLARDPALVAKEVGQGLVTVEGARDYGVVIADGVFDADQTEALRAEIRAARPETLALFDYGPDIETLRANCEAETGPSSTPSAGLAPCRGGVIMAHSILRTKLAKGKFFVVPGIQDMIAAVIADRVGFDLVYGTGYWLTASAYGLPDAGIASYTQMLDRMATLARTSKAALIADADTGYGGLLNVHHTVRGYEAAGVTAIQFEDQEFPKKCGHTPYKRLIPLEEMVTKIKVAVAARTDSENMRIIARTDARQSEGLDGAFRRLEAYATAGADILFPEALHSEEEMRAACAAFDHPVMANMSNGGLTPVPKAGVLAEIGYAFAIYPSLTSLVAARAMEQALIALRDEGIGQPDDLFDFDTFCRMIGFEDVWAFEQKWQAEG